MADQQERYCNKCRHVLPLANFPKPVGNCTRCREREVRKQYENAMQRLQAGGVAASAVRRVRNYRTHHYLV
jgi:uncharacterized paraquat-inducible protein A